MDKIRFLLETPRYVATLHIIQHFPNFSMALFNQSKGMPRGKYERTGGDINRALDRAKGGRGRRLRRTRGSKKAFFNSTRIDQKNRSDSDRSEKASGTDTELASGSGSSSNDEEDATAAASATKPYTTLLRSLNDTTQRGQPQGKKRKRVDIELSGETEVVEDVDLVIELEETEDLGIGELTDDDGDDEAEKGLLLLISRDDPAYFRRP